MKRVALLVWAVSAMVCLAQTPHKHKNKDGDQTSSRVSSAAQPDDSPVESTADKFEVDQKTGWVTLTGHVHIRTGEQELEADHVRMNQDKGDVQARGNVVIRQRNFGTWSGDYIEYNYKTGKGLTGNGDIRVGPFRILSHEVTRLEDGRYDARYMQVTTCTNAPGHWHWMVSGHGRYKDNDYIEIFDAVPWMFGVPLGYLPYCYRDIDTHYGFRFIPGYTSKWGAYMLGGYIFNIYDSPRAAGPSVDGMTHVDYRTRRGAGVGQDVLWDLKDYGRGSLKTYYAWDTDPPDSWDNRNWMSKVDEDRYRITFKHAADLSPRDEFLVQGTYLSDSEVMNDYFNREYRGESTPYNFASLEHREHTWASGVTVSGPLNDFYGGVARLPEGWLNVEPQPVFNTPVNYEGQTRAGYLDRDAAFYENADPDYKYYPGSWANYDVARMDTAHRLTLPVKLDDVVSVVPRAGYRGTYYSDTQYNSDVIRNSYEVGVETSVRGTSDWNNGIRHVVEPYLDYSYQPTFYDYSENGKTYAFDRFDRSFEWQDQFGFDGTWLPYDWHGVRPGLRNLFQESDDNNKKRTVLDLDTYAGVQFDSDGPDGEEGLRLYGTKILYSPTKKVDIKAQADWDNEEDKVAYADLSSFYKMTDKFRVGGGYLARDHALYDYDKSVIDDWNYAHENLIYGGFTHEINDTWTWSTYVRYDLLEGELDEVGGYVQYSLDCLVFQVRTAYVEKYTRIDGTERDSDYRVAFMMWLRADKHSQIDQWLTW